MPLRYSLLFQVTTDPTNRSAAIGHAGGWSESFYIAGTTPITFNSLASLADARAILLGQECAIVGYRTQTVTISGNRLLPGGTGSGTLQSPGVNGNTINSPWDALMVNLTLNGQAATVRHRLAGLPDAICLNGEFQPYASWSTNLRTYIAGLLGLGAARS